MASSLTLSHRMGGFVMGGCSHRPIISVPFPWKLSEVGREQGFNVIIANIHLKPNPRRKVIRFNGHRPSEWKSTGLDLLNLIRPCFSLSHPNCVSISALTPGLIQRAKFSLYAAMESCLLFLHSPHVSQGPLSRVLPTWCCMVAIYSMIPSRDLSCHCLGTLSSSGAEPSSSETAGHSFSRTSSVPSQGQRPWGFLTAHQTRI